MLDNVKAWLLLNMGSKIVLVFACLVMASFISWNVNGCHDSLKRYNILSSLKSNHYADFYFLQETHSTVANQAQWQVVWRAPIYFSHGTSNSAGVAVLFPRNKNVDVVSVKSVVQGRLLHLHIKMDDTSFHLLNIYAPSSGDDRCIFFESLRKFLLDFDLDNENIVIGGDFNCTLVPDLDRSSHIEPHLKSSQVFSSLVHRCKLSDAWRYFHKQAQNFTWQRGEQKSRIDTFFINKRLTSKIKSVSIDSPTDLSDHSLVSLVLTMNSSVNKNPVWCLNTSLLNDENYCTLIKEFWEGWRNEKDRFSSLQSWWDIGKQKIKELSQQYSAERVHHFKRSKQKLIEEIRTLETLIHTQPSLKTRYHQQKDLLDSFQKLDTRGAVIRSRFQQLNDSDTNSQFFFSLEKYKGCRKSITHLQREDHTITENQREIRQLTRQFYQNLFTAEPVSPEAQNTLLHDLPQLPADKVTQLDEPISLDEYTFALKNIANGKTPGVDGIPCEFYKKFWSLLGNDFHQVFQKSISDGLLPTSCRRAVITLLPKQGDNSLLKNWRPISLLCSDYKIFTKALSLRLKQVLQDIIHVDQSYTVPGRQIFDNIHLIRDCIHFHNDMNLPLGILSLDQEKAFDRVSHHYLFQTLHAFGFGENFINFIKLLYTQTDSLVRVNSSLTAPVQFSRGIRQGCSLSGQLYAIVIEPLLHRIRQDDSIQGVMIPNSSDRKCKLSAYADDVNTLVTCDTDFLRFKYWFAVYEHASNAKINYRKSQGLWVGSWRGRADRPLEIPWNSIGLKLLGTYLGNSNEYF